MAKTDVRTKVANKKKDTFYNQENIKRIKESIKQLNEGKTVVKTMRELEAMENE